MVLTRPAKPAAALVLAMVVCARSSSGAASTPNPGTIALTRNTGAFGPNIGNGSAFTRVGGARLNRSGRFVFYGEAGPGTAGSPGIWAGSGQARDVLAMDGDAVPGFSGARYSAISGVGVRIFGDGDAVFSSQLVGDSDPALNVSTHLAVQPGQARVIARRRASQGPAAPLAFSDISGMLINGAHSVAFYGSPTGATSVLWQGEPGVIRAAATQGTSAPDTPAGTLWGESMGYRALNRNGQTLISSNLTSATGANLGRACFMGDDSSTRLVLRSTDQAPGEAPGVAVGDLSICELSDNGTVGVATEHGLYIGAAGNLRVSAAIGGQAPGRPTGVRFSAISAVKATSPGAFAFSATLSTQGPESIWIDQGTGPREIVVPGQQAPGAPAGVLLSSVSIETSSTESGLLLVSAVLAGPGVGPGNGTAAYVWDPQSGLLPVVRAGDIIGLGDGTTKSIVAYGDVGLVEIAPGSLIPGSTRFAGPDAPVGVVTYLASFQDGTTGLFASAIPVPTTAGVLLLAGLAASRRRTRSVQ